MPRISNFFFVLSVAFALALLAPPTTPLAPRDACAATSITLQWDANDEPDVGYKLYYGTRSRFYEFAIDVGPKTTYTISGFLEGVDYYFAVTAYNTTYGLESDFSDEVSYPGTVSASIPLATGWNLISLPVEPLDHSITTLTSQISPCLNQVVTFMDYMEVFYDPSSPDQSTLLTMEPGIGYLVEMACPAEMTVVGNKVTNPIPLTVDTNIVGYNSLISIPVSQALESIKNKYATVWALKGDQWTIYDPYDETWTTLKELSPGGGYLIDVIEETTWTLPSAAKIPLAEGWNLISLPLEPLNPSVADLAKQLSPCLRQVYTIANDTELYFDPSLPNWSTLITLEPGRGYLVEMACPREMTIVGNRVSKPISLTVGTNIVGYNSLAPLPVSQALATIADKYTTVWALKGGQWTIYDPYDENWTTLKELSPGSGYLIDVIEEVTWTLPYFGY
ncbi:MAG: fibronectin type III domain-containing protein [Thermodesulfobacteriota bacterium]